MISTHKMCLCYYALFLSYLGKFKAKFEVLDICSIRIKGPSLFFIKKGNT